MATTTSTTPTLDKIVNDATSSTVPAQQKAAQTILDALDLCLYNQIDTTMYLENLGHMAHTQMNEILSGYGAVNTDDMMEYSLKRVMELKTALDNLLDRITVLLDLWCDDGLAPSTSVLRREYIDTLKVLDA